MRLKTKNAERNHVKMKSKIFAIIFLQILYSCTAPSSYEQYMRKEDSDAGTYEFDVDMTDSLCCYDISLYLSGIMTGKNAVSYHDDPVEFVWVSPRGQKFCERLYLPKDVRKNNPSHYICEYRKDLVPVSRGTWKLYIIPASIGEAGVGIRITKKKNGTR